MGWGGTNKLRHYGGHLHLYTKTQRTVGHPLFPGDWVYDLIRSRLLSPQMSRLQNRTEQLIDQSKHIGQQLLLLFCFSICKFGVIAVWTSQGLSSPLWTCSLWGLIPLPATLICGNLVAWLLGACQVHLRPASSGAFPRPLVLNLGSPRDLAGASKYYGVCDP